MLAALSSPNNVRNRGRVHEKQKIQMVHFFTGRSSGLWGDGRRIQKRKRICASGTAAGEKAENEFKRGKNGIGNLFGYDGRDRAHSSGDCQLRDYQILP